MRYLRIFLLYFHDAFVDRARSFVWLLLPFINGGFYLIFWHAAFTSNNSLPGWDSNSILTYYLLLTIAAGLLLSHVEVQLDLDIRQGDIIKYLLKPFSFYWTWYFFELPYRIIQGSYGIVIFCVIAYFFPAIRISFHDIPTLFVLFSIFVCAFLLTFTYKMILGMITFWTTDNKGIVETAEVLILFFAGFNLPLPLLPGSLADIALSLPFAYFIYFPVVSLQGKLSLDQLLHVLIMQLMWLGVFLVAYNLLLKNGLKKFTAVGQ